ncbi:hypothetical protein SFC65_19060 [Priestia filamentosa]|uniref:hypothetical protein n=1 Tax=Priestia filamentosa TaxID=1402861 RepID=UPI003982C7D1
MNATKQEDKIRFFVKIYGDKVERYFRARVINQKASSLSPVKIEDYIKGDMSINGRTFPIYYRKSTLKERHSQKEDNRYVKLESVFNSNIRRRTFIRVSIGAQYRNDDVYMSCFTANDYDVQIPLGFCPSRGDFSNLSLDILTDEERNLFHPLMNAYKLIKKWKYAHWSPESERRDLKRIINVLFNDERIHPRGALTDSEKNQLICKAFNQNRIDALTLIREIKEIVKS